ncbi:MAG: hypothetical protein NTZ68_00265 [Candidatus Dependentiae bacterium]|nr:hypothetical protein [Candidatus Dependentiae bacterium]
MLSESLLSKLYYLAKSSRALFIFTLFSFSLVQSSQAKEVSSSASSVVAFTLGLTNVSSLQPEKPTVQPGKRPKPSPIKPTPKPNPTPRIPGWPD